MYIGRLRSDRTRLFTSHGSWVGKDRRNESRARPGIPRPLAALSRPVVDAAGAFRRHRYVFPSPVPACGCMFHVLHRRRMKDLIISRSPFTRAPSGCVCSRDVMCCSCPCEAGDTGLQVLAKATLRLGWRATCPRSHALSVRPGRKLHTTATSRACAGNRDAGPVYMLREKRPE